MIVICYVFADEGFRALFSSLAEQPVLLLRCMPEQIIRFLSLSGRGTERRQTQESGGLFQISGSLWVRISMIVGTRIIIVHYSTRMPDLKIDEFLHQGEDDLSLICPMPNTLMFTLLFTMSVSAALLLLLVLFSIYE